MGTRDNLRSNGGFVHCYAEGKPDVWEAFCFDLDLAVQGKTFPEVYQKLNDQIALYADTVADLPEADRQRMLNRHMPRWTQLARALRLLRSMFSQRRDGPWHSYTQPMGPYAPA